MVARQWLAPWQVSQTDIWRLDRERDFPTGVWAERWQGYFQESSRSDLKLLKVKNGQKLAHLEDSVHHMGLRRNVLTSRDEILGKNPSAKGNLDTFPALLGLAWEGRYQHASCLNVNHLADLQDQAGHYLPSFHTYAWWGEGPFPWIFCLARTLAFWEKRKNSVRDRSYTQDDFLIHPSQALALRGKAGVPLGAIFSFLRVWPSFSLFNIHQKQGQEWSHLSGK